MKLTLLLPIRHETTSQGSDMYYVSLDTSLYINRVIPAFKITGFTDEPLKVMMGIKTFKLCLLGLGVRITL